MALTYLGTCTRLVRYRLVSMSARRAVAFATGFGTLYTPDGRVVGTILIGILQPTLLLGFAVAPVLTGLNTLKTG